LKVKIATEEWEFEAIHRLNYKTFVEEIPQHQAGATQRLRDKFHHENTYIICLHGKELAGMMAMRAGRPFSLDKKIENLDSYLPRGRKLVEIRLLAVEKDFRNGHVFRGMLALLVQHGKAQGYNVALISGTTRQAKLYRHLGFVPFGPLVGAGEALFQPMYLTLETLEEKAKKLLKLPTLAPMKVASFLPGPVSIHEEVQQALSQPPVSHRCEAFLSEFKFTKQLLCELTGASQVEILLGSGTLANDVVAGQLSLVRRPGLILSNGEFGERLIDQAARLGLRFETYSIEWGRPFDLEAVERLIEKSPKLDWLWTTHCETSTGVMNDRAGLKRICAENEVKLCLDCISSVGTAPVNLHGVYLASCVSGKGLAAFPGLSMVFYNHTLTSAPKALPRYLDLGFYAANDGVPFTHSSNMLNALQAALRRQSWQKRFKELVETCAWLRIQLRDAGFDLVAGEAISSPAVVTLALPRAASARMVGDKLHQSGYLLSYASEYLLRRNWIQICLMGECSRDALQPVIDNLVKHCFSLQASART
jgi:aspartate aminotransferase-like enzyme